MTAIINAILYKTVILARPVFAVMIPSGPATFAPLQELDIVIANLVQVAIALGGLACFALILVGGFFYLTAGGDDKAIKKAKDILTYAIAGLVVVVGAYLVLNTLFNGVLNFGPIEFTLPS